MDDRIRTEAERRAEQIKDRPEGVDGPVEAADPDTLIHELRVHQIELELQNEELRTTQSELENTRDEYAQLYNDAPIGYVSLDAAGVIRRANRTFATVLLVDLDTALDRPVVDFIVPEERDAFLRRYTALFKQPRGKSIDITLRSADGSRRVFQMTSARLSARDEHLHVAFLDVSNRKRAEEYANEVSAQKQLLLRELNHRTKNNYQIIMSMLSLQAGMDDDPKTHHTLEAAKGRVRAMMVVHEALSRSEDDAGTDVAVYLEELINRIVAVLDPDGRIHLSTEFEQCRVNPTLAYNIGIIVNEVVTNAYKHAFGAAGDGSLRITVGSSSGNMGQPVLRLMISDSTGANAGTGAELRGEGPSPEAPATSESAGLGRLIVDSLANQMRGRVETDTHSTGTRFVLEVPVGAEA